MTEEEAGTKWCPFASVLGTLSVLREGVETVIAHGPQNRGYQMGGGLDNCRCIGSACMAWRWVEEKWGPGTRGMLGQVQYREPSSTGRCGLAS